MPLVEVDPKTEIVIPGELFRLLVLVERRADYFIHGTSAATKRRFTVAESVNARAALVVALDQMRALDQLAARHNPEQHSKLPAIKNGDPS